MDELTGIGRGWEEEEEEWKKKIEDWCQNGRKLRIYLNYTT